MGREEGELRGNSVWEDDSAGSQAKPQEDSEDILALSVDMGVAHLSQREGHVSLGNPVVQRTQGVAEGEHIADGGHPSPPA
jgi:hypothetical protein